MAGKVSGVRCSSDVRYWQRPCGLCGLASSGFSQERLAGLNVQDVWSSCIQRWKHDILSAVHPYLGQVLVMGQWR